MGFLLTTYAFTSLPAVYTLPLSLMLQHICRRLLVFVQQNKRERKCKVISKVSVCGQTLKAAGINEVYMQDFFLESTKKGNFLNIVCISSFLHTNIDLTKIIFQEMPPKHSYS